MRDWLQSPVHNKRPEVLLLFEELQTAIHYLKIPLERKRLFRTIFPQQDFNAQQLRQLCHYLLRATESWMTAQAKPKIIDLSLLKIYRERQLGRLFDQTYKRLSRQLELQAYRNPEYYLQRWELAKAYYAKHSTKGRQANLNVEEQEHFLQVATLGLKLRQACLTKAKLLISNEKISIPMLAAIAASARQPIYQAIPMIRVYSLALQLYAPQLQEAPFQSFSEEFDLHAEIFPKEEARDLLLLGINYSIKRINSGQQEYLKSCLTLFKRGLTNELLLEGGQIDPITYNNIAGIAIRLKEIEWATTFIDNYRSKLNSRSREAVYTLNRARIAYLQKAYKEALQLLSILKDRDFIHQMSARILQLKIYVDTQDIDFAFNHIYNTRTYLKRRKNKGYHSQNYLNILRLTEAWCKLAHYDTKGLMKWQKEVQQTNPLTEKEWLLQL